MLGARKLKNKKTNLFRVVLLISVLAGVLRIYAANNLWPDGDESTYMKRAVDYSNFLRSGSYKMLAVYDLSYEHPALYKILYGVALLTVQPIANFSSKWLAVKQPASTTNAATWIMTDRYLSVIFGTLTVMILALVNPLAGLFLAVDTLSVKYTSEVYLEALPLLTSLLCSLAYLHWFNQVSQDASGSRRINWWLIISAIFLGLTAASKYIYCVVGIVIVLHFTLALVQKQIPSRFLFGIVAWAVLALIAFFIFDPYIWPDPVARLSRSVLYNVDYSHSEHVLGYHYPFWQPLIWLSAFSSYWGMNPRLAFIFDVDTPIFILAVLGMPRLFRNKRFFFYWLVVGLVFLFAWNTKWPQYVLIVQVPLGFSAAEGMFTAWDLGRKFFLTEERMTSEGGEQVPETLVNGHS